jgi:hypothetical protein
MRTAFKEWAVVVDALGRGDQVLVLRKGGISEGRDGFRIEHPKFLLFPTRYHQQRESVTTDAQARFDEIAPRLPPPELVRIEYFAEAVVWRQLDSLSAAESLRGQHCWRDEIIEARFDWGKAKNIFAIAVRVHRLPLALELPMLPTYGGCKSWVELEKDVPVTGAVPVLEEPVFDQKLRRFLAALNPVAT